MKKKTIGISVTVLAIIALAVILLPNPSVSGYAAFEGTQATIYKSISCGCCGGYASGLSSKGVDVKTVNLEDTSSIKTKYSIPRSMESCHTTIIGDYFIEGHMPFEAVDKLLTEKPDIKGIALPGMPSGSPGMPGTKRGTWEIYAIGNNGETSVFMTL